MSLTPDEIQEDWLGAGWDPDVWDLDAFDSVVDTAIQYIIDRGSL